MGDTIKFLDIIADMHTHTIFSKHAYSTVKENADVAVERGIDFLAITDHYYGSDDKIDRINELTRMAYIGKNVNHEWVNIISGAEFNLNQALKSDVRVDEVCEKCKWRLAGFHSWFLNPYEICLDSVPEYFEEMISGHTTPQEFDGPTDHLMPPAAFAHIERELFKCCDATPQRVKETLTRIVDLALENNIILEINETSLLTSNSSNKHRELMEYWISYALNSGKPVMFSFGSDAHYCSMVGSFENAVDLANKLGIAPEQIINHKVNRELLQNLLS